MLYYICYDISNNRKRKKVSDILTDYGLRVQYSIFQAELTAKKLKEIQKKTDPLIDKKTDSIMFLPLCKNCEEKIVLVGNSYSVIKLNFISDVD